MGTVFNLDVYRDTGTIETVSMAESISELSFMDPVTRVWAPSRTGNYSTDCAAGRAYARELLAFISRQDAYPLLGHVCASMNRSNWDGVEVGFCHEIAAAAVRA